MDTETQVEEETPMLTGNRKTAVVIAGLLALGLTALSSVAGVPDNIVHEALAAEVLLAGGGALVTRD